MKKNILLCFLISISYILSAQDTINQIKFGVVINYDAKAGHDTYNAINPCVIIHYKRHSVLIGALFNPINNEIAERQHLFPVDITNTKKKCLIGLQMGYKFYPNKKSKIFNFFFDYNLDLLKAHYDYYTGIYNMATQAYENSKANLEIFNFYNFIGYGFDINFLKHFYLTTDFGVGIGWYRYYCNQSFINGLEISSNSYNLEPNLIAKIGLEYHFLTLKK
jgi:hypothetical protein